MSERNKKGSRTRTSRRSRRYSNGSADNPFENYAEDRKRAQSSFRKILTLMTIVFFTAIFAILLFANQDNFLSQKLGENSFISNMLAKLSKENNSKDKPEFVLPFGLRRQNILLLGVDSNGAD